MTLNFSGSAIWRLCDGQRSLEEIAEQLAGEFSADKSVLDDQVKSFVDRLIAEGFLTLKDGLLPDRLASGMYLTPPEYLNFFENNRKRVRPLGLGFSKVRLDPELHERLRNHLAANVHNFRSEDTERLVRTEDSRVIPSVVYLDAAFNRQVLTELQPAHEEWSGMPLNQAACFGVRVYQNGSYLFNHIDHSRTHVVSGTICIDSKLRRPWPLYIEDQDGNPHEVSIEPGEMVFFEGARLMHGRPYPMDGDYYASMFVHYTPIGWDLDDEA
ncbi:MAG: PqqD family protein [Rhodobiaceae bacterium]|nr:PqqD family protein [Rhodobiaceae bacterium]